VQRIQAAQPQLASLPLGLIHRDARRGLVVAAANLAARSARVKAGMRLAEATGLTPLETASYEPQEDLEALCSLAEQAQQFSPLVGIEQLDRHNWAGRHLHQPECLLLDLTGLGQLFGGYDNMLLQIGGWLNQQRLFGCLAIGRTVGSAWALANYALRSAVEPQPSSIQTRQISTEPQQGDPGTASSSTTNTHKVPPSRYLHHTDEQDSAVLDGLPISALRINQTICQTLRRLGVGRIGQLSQLPRSGLASRFDADLLLRYDQLTGVQREAIVSLHQLPCWSIDQQLEYPTDRSDTLAELLRRQLVELCDRLACRGEGALRLVCRLDLVQQRPLLLQLSLFRPTSDASHLNMLASSMMDQKLKGLSAPAWRISTQATLTSPLIWRQTDLFDSHLANARNDIAQLIDTLSARLGRKQVLRVNLQRESQPENAYTLKPLTGLKIDGSSLSPTRQLSSRQSLRNAEPLREDPLRRPTQLIDPPIPIQVAGRWHSHSTEPIIDNDTSGSSIAAAPAQIKTANGWHRIESTIGPERLESGWWRAASVRRDYYRVITHQGCWWWIYRDLNSGQWFLHGIFD
jgi:protein ImuB